MEAIDFKPVSGRYRWVILTNTLLVWIIMAALILSAPVLFDTNWPPMTQWLLAGGWSLLLAVYLAFQMIAFKYRGYALREPEVLYRAGVLSRYTLIIPIRHIQHVKINESFISRQLGLATIELFTAGTGRDMRLMGLEKSDALALQQHISTRIALPEEASEPVISPESKTSPEQPAPQIQKEEATGG